MPDFFKYGACTKTMLQMQRISAHFENFKENDGLIFTIRFYAQFKIGNLGGGCRGIYYSPFHLINNYSMLKALYFLTYITLSMKDNDKIMSDTGIQPNGKICKQICNCMSGFGHLLVGFAACYALWKSDGLLDKVMEIKVVVDEVKKVVTLSEEERKNRKLERIISIPDSEQRVQIFKNTIPSNADKLKPGDIYIPQEKYNEALGVLKGNDLQNQNSFLSNNLMIWERDKK